MIGEAAGEVGRSALAGAEPGPSRLSGRTAASIPLAVTYQGSEGIAFVAQPRREATQPYEQYGVVLPPIVVRELAMRMLASVPPVPINEEGTKGADLRTNWSHDQPVSAGENT